MDKKSRQVRRAVLQCRLAAERANLFYELRGLDEKTLCTTPLHDGWTVRDILPHLGYWDAFYAEQLETLIAGCRDEIELPSGEDALEQRNAEVRHTFAHLDLGQATAVAVKERNGFLATLARTPDDVLFRRVYVGHGVGHGQRVTPSTWVRHRYEHDAEHAAAIGQWRTGLLGNRSPKPPASAIILRPFLAASRRELMALAGLIAPDERHTRPVCGSWTLCDVLGHLTLYESMGVTALSALANGKQPQFDRTIRNFDTFNDAQALARRHIDWDQTLAEYKAMRKALMKLVDQLSESKLMIPYMAPWGSPITGYYYVFSLGLHEQEHAAILRQALGLSALPGRLRHYRPA